MVKIPVEPCPSCHSGILIRVEMRADNVRTKYFSCGHAGYEVQLEDKLEMHASLSYKAKHRGRGKPYLQRKTGEDFCRDQQKWVERQLVADRETDRYKEIVIDPETGKVIHHCEEPLSQHRGHGSAKPQKPQRLTSLRGPGCPAGRGSVGVGRGRNQPAIAGTASSAGRARGGCDGDGKNC